MVKILTNSRISLYNNRQNLYKASDVKIITGADLVCNGGLFNSDYSPCCHLKINGEVLGSEPYSYWGYGFNARQDKAEVMHSGDIDSVDNYIACIFAIRNGEREPLDDNASGIGGSRGRTAFGYTADGDMVFVCTKDGTENYTLTETQTILLNNGCVDGIILDGGGSSQCDGECGSVYSIRAVPNMICVSYDEARDGLGLTVEGKQFKVCIDCGHGAKELNQSPDGKYLEYVMAWDLGNRIKALLEKVGFDVKLTKDTAEDTPTLSERATIANEFGADLFLSIHSNAVGGNDWNDEVSGFTAWVYDFSGERYEVAKKIIAQCNDLGIETFGLEIFKGKFTVLAKTNMPAVLTENYFHTNHEDVEKLQNSDELDKLALAHALAVCEHFGVSADKLFIPEDKPEESEKAKIYRVQVGAFTNEEYARRLQDELISKGYGAFVVEG